MKNNPHDRVANVLAVSGRSTIKPQRSAGIGEILARPCGFSATIHPAPGRSGRPAKAGVCASVRAPGDLDPGWARLILSQSLLAWPPRRGGFHGGASRNCSVERSGHYVAVPGALTCVDTVVGGHSARLSRPSSRARTTACSRLLTRSLA